MKSVEYGYNRIKARRKDKIPKEEEKHTFILKTLRSFCNILQEREEGARKFQKHCEIAQDTG